MFFQSPLQGMFLLGTLLAPSQLVLFFSITKVPKAFFSHFAVVLVVNNPMQRDEHTKGQYTNAMHMHVHAFHTHTHTLNAHMIYTCMYVWIVYSPCLLDVIDLIGLLCLIWMHMHKHTTHSARTCHMHMHTHTHMQHQRLIA